METQRPIFVETGLWNVFCDTISFDAIKFLILNGSFYHLLHENPNAAEWIITMIKMFQMSEHLVGSRMVCKKSQIVCLKMQKKKLL